MAGMTMKKIMISAWAVTKTVVEVAVAGEPLDAGLLQFHTDADRQRTADDAREDREDKVHRADVLMVRRIDETAPPCRGVVVVSVSVVCGRHCRSNSWA
jgi:hypothetical protein